MNLRAILADVYRRCGHPMTPAAEVVTRITAFINETQQDIFSEPGMEWMLNDQTTLTSVVAQAEYGLPNSIQRIKAIRDTTNRRTLRTMSVGRYRQQFPAPALDPGVPEYFVDMGMSPVAQQPSAAQQLTVVGTSPSDNGIAYLEGFITGGIPYSTSVQMTNTTPVNIGLATIESITKFYVSVPTIGEVRLRNAATTVISRITLGQTVPHYRMIALVPTPVSVLTYYADFERSITDMTIPQDEPLLPERFHRIVSVGTRVKEWERQKNTEMMAVARGEYIETLKNLKFWVLSNAAGTPNLRSNARNRPIASAINVATS